jgi:hypothetical protein
MTIYRSDTVRNALMDALDTVRGASVKIQLRTTAPDGSGGAGAAVAELTGNVGGWAGASAAGVLTSSAITDDSSAAGNATAVGHYELLLSNATWMESGVVDIDGATDGVALDNLTINAAQVVTMGGAGTWVNTAAYDVGV